MHQIRAGWHDLLVLTLIFSALLACAAANPPDIVRLKDGGFMRGTISEIVPGDYVVITLPNGESRRITMDKVEFAGPDPAADQGPGGPKGQVATGPAVKLRLSSPQKEARFFVTVGTRIGKIQTSRFEEARTVRTDEFKELCLAPCDVALEPGSYELALAVDDGEPIRSDATIDLRAPMTVEGVYTDYGVVRAAGWVTSAVGLAVGVVLLIKPPSGETEVTLGRILPGALVIVGSGLVGQLMRSIEDDAEIYVVE